MKKLVLFALVAALSITVAASEAKKKKDIEYEFQCMNYWNQSRLITVPAPTLDDARAKLRNDYTLFSEYNNKCSYRGEKIKSLSTKKEKKEKPVTPGE